MIIDLELADSEYDVIAAVCKKNGKDVKECLQNLFSGAVESYLEDCESK